MENKTIDHGNKNTTSKSKIINNIETKQNLISNFCRASSKGLKPHSYAETFSFSKIRLPNKKETKYKTKAMTKANVNKKIKLK